MCANPPEYVVISMEVIDSSNVKINASKPVV